MGLTNSALAVPINLGQLRRDRVPAINSLPRDIDDFTGRAEVVSHLLAMIESSPGNGKGPIAIHSIEGIGGVGKTSLAVHVAHRLTERYHDAALFIDMRAHGEGRKPLTTYEAVGILLSDLGVPGEKIPDSLEARISTWRRELAHASALIILDNAASAEQVKDLLAAGPGCLFLITSRRRLFRLDGVSTVPLGILSPGEAATLFQRVLGIERSVGQEADIANMVQRLGYLPLAVRLAAAWLRQHHAWTVRDLLKLNMSQDITLRGIYTQCYRDLGPREKKFFRLLAVHPGSEITADAAAVLTRTTQPEAMHMLEELYDRYLIEEPLPRRFKFHDLIKEFASQEISDMGSSPERRDALLRLLEWYTFVASAASASIGMHDLFVVNAPVGVPDDGAPRDERAGLDWFDAELGNLLACANYASDRSLLPYAWQIPASMTSYLRLRGFLAQAVTLLESALDSLMRQPDTTGEAIIRRRIGHVARLQGRYELSREQLEKSLELTTELGDRNGLAWCHHELGHLNRASKRYRQARAHFMDALAIQRDLQNSAAQAAAEINLAIVLHDNGDPADIGTARVYLHEALATAQQSGDRRAEAFALYQLGSLERDSGDSGTAREMLDRALAIYENAGNRHGEADCHFHLGKAERLDGNYESAMHHLNQALRIYVELGYRRNEADTYAEFAVTAAASNNPELSLVHRQTADNIYAEMGMINQEAGR
jgi:tetratricopeptide (TPR) repeat protein